MLAQSNATVTVNASHVEGIIQGFGQYNSFSPNTYPNNSSAESIPNEDFEILDQVNHKIIRLWVRFQGIYDFVSDTYDFGYKPGYFEKSSEISDELLINYDGDNSYVFDAANQRVEIPQSGGSSIFLTYAKYQEVQENILSYYKSNFPKLIYVEVRNEKGAAINSGQYYEFYKIMYRAINQVNASLNPSKPLKIGGPITASFGNDIQVFLDQYAADPSSQKKLDFIAWHEYLFFGETLTQRVEDDRAVLEGWLAARNLPTNLPALVTETGIFPGGECGHGRIGENDCGSVTSADLAADKLANAAAMANMHYYYLNANSAFSSNAGDVFPFYWTPNHLFNARKDLVVRTQSGIPEPTFNVMKMQSLMEKARVTATSNGTDANGNGVNAVASRSNDQITTMLWNYQYTNNTSYNITFQLNNIPSSIGGSSFTYEVYKVDANTSNFNNGGASNAFLTKVTQETVSASTSLTKSITLGKNAVALVVVRAGTLQPDFTLRAVDYSGKSTNTNISSGSTGTYADLPSSSGFIEWNPTLLAGNYDLRIVYANGSTTSRDLNLVLNGTNNQSVSFSPTGSWANLGSVTLSGINLSQNPIIRLDGVNGPNIYKIEVFENSVSNQLEYISDEYSSKSSDVQILTNSTGTYADFPSGSGFLEWLVNPGNGTFNLEFQYANGSSTSRSLDLKVNGSTIQTINFNPTGSWSTLTTVTISTQNFGSGNSTLRIEGTNGPNVYKATFVQTSSGN
ncbi:MAG: hypothetical protein HC880_10240, partial [Bacteroidia bacterium]|nr:hypothetical protein [Bacteroidia bacterium]